MEQKIDQSPYNNQLLKRFLSYVEIDSSSDPYSQSSPSSAAQKNLSKKLVMDLYEIGMEHVTVDINGYIMATLPANTRSRVPAIGFIANYDTTPDIPSIGRNYRILDSYNGEEISLNELNPDLRLSPAEFPELGQYQGHTLVTSDGTSILGADGKAGLAEIITAMELLRNQNELKHGPIRIAFAPDEEIGRGSKHFDLDSFGAEWAYFMKASALGELQYESFNAAEAHITVRGRKSHTGFARGQMVNAGRLALEFLQLLPPEEIPELTSGNQGFFHLSEIDGSIDQAKLVVQVRDHDKGQFEARKKLLTHFIERMNEEYPEAFQLNLQDLYYNMLDAIEPHMHMVEAAARSMVAMGIKPLVRPIRGGNLSVDLSRQGLPCISLFTGGHNFNGPFEYISLNSMEKAVQVITRIASFTEKHHRN